MAGQQACGEEDRDLRKTVACLPRFAPSIGAAHCVQPSLLCAVCLLSTGGRTALSSPHSSEEKMDREKTKARPVRTEKSGPAMRSALLRRPDPFSFCETVETLELHSEVAGAVWKGPRRWAGLPFTYRTNRGACSVLFMNHRGSRGTMQHPTEARSLRERTSDLPMLDVHHRYE